MHSIFRALILVVLLQTICICQYKDDSVIDPQITIQNEFESSYGKGWQFSFYDEILEPQWTNLRQQLIKAYGPKRDHRALPKIGDVPLNDPGGVITDTWELEDRLVVLAVQAFEIKDCCTNRLIEYTTCLVLIQPK